MDNLEKVANQDYDKNRFEQEMIYYIEKLDVNEEKEPPRQPSEIFHQHDEKTDTDKAKSSVSSLRKWAAKSTRSVRKATMRKCRKIVVQMKDELEQIKEQVLNVL